MSRIPHAIETVSLTRRFPRSGSTGDGVVALDSVSLVVPEGEVLGVLGPNGAGKTTLVKILATVLVPTSGSARVLGVDVVERPIAVRQRIGIVLGGERGLYDRLTARQNLLYWAALYNLPLSVSRNRVEELLSRVGLAGHANHRVETFSRGMKQRLHLARGLVGDPRVIFLDEPTTGMDPIAAREFRVLVSQLRTEGRSILITTHDMVEAQAICDRVALIDRGRLLAFESPKTLSKWISQYERVDVESAPPEIVESLRAEPGVGSVTSLDDGWIRIETVTEGAVATVLQRLVAAGVTSVKTSLPTLEEVYFRIVGDRGLNV